MSDKLNWKDYALMFAVGTPSILVVLLWRSYVLVVLWDWFIVPVGAPPISVAAAGGVLLAMMILTKTTKTKEKMTWDKLIGMILFGLMAPALTLGVAWLWKAVMS